MSCSSASVGFWPSDLMTVPSSLVVIVPSPSLSNKEKASLNSVGGEDESGGERLRGVRLEKSVVAADEMRRFN